jgi:hypothetical protein
LTLATGISGSARAGASRKELTRSIDVGLDGLKKRGR